MIKYKLYQNNDKNSLQFKKVYARAVSEETIDTAGLAAHMEKHNTPFSAGVIKGILIDTINCIKELVLDGKSVKLDDLAIFSAGITSEGADSVDDFNASEHIKRIRLKARATGKLRSAQLMLEARVKKYGEYSTKGFLVNAQNAESADNAAVADNANEA